MNTFLGDNVLVSIKRDGEYAPVACATSFSKEETSEYVLVRQNTVRENSYIGTTKDCNLNIEGMATLDALPRFQFMEFVESVGERVEMRITYNAPYGDVMTYECEALITGVTEEAPASDFVTYTVSMLRCGPATMEVVGNWLLDSNDEPIVDSEGYPVR